MAVGGGVMLCIPLLRENAKKTFGNSPRKFKLCVKLLTCTLDQWISGNRGAEAVAGI